MEKTVEEYLRRRVKAAGGRALKLVCPGCTGVPDRLILMPGARVYVHGRLRALGFMVFVPDSRTAVDDMMTRILEEVAVT